MKTSSVRTAGGLDKGTDLGSAYLHELEGGFEVFHRVHFDAEELESHDEADGGLDDVGALLLLSQLLQLRDELLPHCWEPAEETTQPQPLYSPGFQ